MRGVSRLALIAYALAIAVVVADQALKYWILEVFRLPARMAERAALFGADHAGVPLIWPLRLSMVWNKGVSFGFLNGDYAWTRWTLTLFDIAVAGALAVWVRRVERPILALAIGLIIGGALGNMIDRVRIGRVVDFIDVSQLWFPWVFNIADSGVSIGVALLLWDALMAPRKRAPSST